ncbi:PD-(D/E)XK nuclease family protein [Lyngbya sp. CCY1209]|uniref:PD-(D/E)XK nuclease family protein n=1 Tax=Lyngbya sp. CCY1209 TaxID=2886103 RepID=UPI002D206124|nr:PD-(D/E)XK nuclease family protein [Lyngbya sp. CCY1209]MEB3885320.1 PD-(D/E)XK nuclease family protein [Lyngbya sp. CCY1209]
MIRFRLSQQHLNRLESCPRQFQHADLEGSISPKSSDLEERIAWGERFHLLMQQRELGLPIAALMAEEPQLEEAFRGLMAAAPELFQPPERGGIWRDAEHHRRLSFGEYLLVAVYDLLIAGEKEAQIIDWKTYPRPKDRTALANNWQTRLYLYLLVETSDYSPEQVSMTYWFVRSSRKSPPEKATFSYDRQTHRKTEQDLRNLCDRLGDDLNRYERGEPFPQVDEASGMCRSCPFARRCDRAPETDRGSADETALPRGISDIKEIPI